MTHGHKISLNTAILICMNVMFGTGIFINTVSLAQTAGALGFVSYCIGAILVMPLMLSMAEILRYYPSGGFYVYGAECVSPLTGFISAWAYFVGKLGSAALLVNVFVSLIKNIFPEIAVNTLLLDAIILIIFGWLNLLGARTGKKIMYMFMVMKVMPILFAILACLYLFNYWSMPPETFLWEGIPTTLPLVLYAFIGFETATSISRTIENAKVNGPKAILYSFSIVVALNILYQLLFFLVLGEDLMAQANYLGAFPALLEKLLPSYPLLALHIKNIIHLVLATSALGGAYGIIFSNHWNLFAIAQNKHTFFSETITKYNRYGIPFWGIIIEALICISYLLLTHGKVVILQQISVFGCLISYALTTVALLITYKNEEREGRYHNAKIILPYLAMLSCAGLTALCIRNLLIEGPVALYAFIGLIVLGIIMFTIQKYKK